MPDFIAIKTHVVSSAREFVRLEIRRNVSRNAINFQMMDELTQAISVLERASSIGALIVTAEGDEIFISGGDLKEFGALKSHDQALDLNRRMTRLLRRMELLEFPVIMAINGTAIGGGCEFLLAGDYRIMANGARLEFRQIALGVTCGWGGITRLQRLLGRDRAFKILMVHPILTSERALQWGVVDELASRDQLNARAVELASQFAELPPLAARSTKRCLARVSEMPYELALEYEGELFARTWASEEHWKTKKAYFLGRNK